MTALQPSTPANGRSPTVVHALLDAEPTQPLMTFYDDATGERVELSGTTLTNWVAKTANLLSDGLGLAPGDVAVVRLPPHWLSAAVLLGCWATGLTVNLTGESPAAVAFVTGDAAAAPGVAAAEIFALSLLPMGMPFRGGPPAGTQDFSVEVRQYGDRLPPVAARPGSPALTAGRGRTGEPTAVTNHAALVAAAATRGVPVGARILIDADEDADPVAWLVAPLVARASTVLCRNLDQARVQQRLTDERATRL